MSCHHSGVYIKFFGKAIVHWSEQKYTGSGESRKTETVHYGNEERFESFRASACTGQLSMLISINELQS